MSDDAKTALEDFRVLVANNADMLKPFFGLMFWQLNEAERSMTPEEFGEQGMNLTMDDLDDEVLAAFLASFVNIWRSANDFNAASRFVCNSLGMTADELLQARQLYLNQLSD